MRLKGNSGETSINMPSSVHLQPLVLPEATSLYPSGDNYHVLIER